MSGKNSMQEQYLRNQIEKRTVMRVLLTTGKDLRGIIKASDTFTLLMDIGGTELLIYKSAIAAMGPAGKPQQMYNENNAERPQHAEQD